MPARAPATARGVDREGKGARGSAISVFLSAGEASGDWVGAMLAAALVRLRPDVELRGIGGRGMAAAGVALAADSSGWGAIGVWEAALKAPPIWRALRAARRSLAESPPSAVALIDCGAFNVPLARAARELGLPALYYFPPGSWSRRPRNLEIRDLVEVIATPFPWSRDLLAGGRARVEWVGHPVVEAARPALSRPEAWRRYGLDPDRAVIALGPGSREQEMRYVLPVLAEAARRLAREFSGLQVLVPVAPSLDAERLTAAFEGSGATVRPLAGMDYDALQLAQAAAICSGTATLELACLGIPMVVVYRASRATTLQYRLIRGLVGGQRFAAIPNIILDREVVPELLGSAATPEAVAREVTLLLSGRSRREAVRAALAQVARELGPPGASMRAAELVLDLVGNREAVSGAAG